VASDKPRVDLSTPIVVGGVWRNLVITEWRGRGSAADMSATYDAAARPDPQVAAQARQPLGRPRPVIRPLDPETRKAIDDAVFDIHPHTAAAALVLPASGFGGAIVRSVLTSINFLRRFDFPNKILATVPAACAFVAPYIDGAPSRRAGRGRSTATSWPPRSRRRRRSWTSDAALAATASSSRAGATTWSAWIMSSPISTRRGGSPPTNSSPHGSWPETAGPSTSAPSSTSACASTT
jgi:hypothetical protein